MADMEATDLTEAVVDDPGCGCCRPDPKTAQDVIRELEARRDDLDRRLARLELVGASR